MKKSSSRLSE